MIITLFDFEKVHSKHSIYLSQHRRALRNKESLESQDRYRESQKAEWLRSLFPELQNLHRFSGNTRNSFYLSQTLSGHCFGADYLNRFGIKETATCTCGAPRQTAKHLLFECPFLQGKIWAYLWNWQWITTSRHHSWQPTDGGTMGWIRWVRDEDHPLPASCQNLILN